MTIKLKWRIPDSFDLGFVYCGKSTYNFVFRALVHPCWDGQVCDVGWDLCPVGVKTHHVPKTSSIPAPHMDFFLLKHGARMVFGLFLKATGNACERVFMSPENGLVNFESFQLLLDWTFGRLQSEQHCFALGLPEIY
jgi:hypothetical protein